MSETIKYEGTNIERIETLKEPKFTEGEVYIPIKAFSITDEYTGNKYVQKVGTPGIILREPTGKKRKITTTNIIQLIITKPYTYAKGNDIYNSEDVYVVFEEEPEKWDQEEDITLTKPRKAYKLTELNEDIYYFIPTGEPIETFKRIFNIKYNNIWKKLCIEQHNKKLVEAERVTFLLAELGDEIQVGEELSISGMLYRDNDDETPLADKDIFITIQQGEQTDNITVKTEEDGSFITKKEVVSEISPITVTMEFRGDKDYDPVTTTEQVSVKQAKDPETDDGE